MKKTLILSLLLFLTGSLSARGKDIGIGLLFGNPTSLVVNYKIEEYHYINMGIGFEPFSNTGLVLHADYLHQDIGLFPNVEYFNFYYGFGVRFSDETNGLGVGARGVFGTYLKHVTLPLEIYMEAAPVFRLFPNTDLQLDWGVGFHYFFDISNFGR